MLYVGEEMQKDSFEDVLKKFEKKIIIVSEDERWDENFKEPTALFIVNAMGEGIYFRTRDRLKAQEIADELYGKGFYTVRAVIKAITR